MDETFKIGIIGDLGTEAFARGMVENREKNRVEMPNYVRFTIGDTDILYFSRAGVYNKSEENNLPPGMFVKDISRLMGDSSNPVIITEATQTLDANVKPVNQGNVVPISRLMRGNGYQTIPVTKPRNENPDMELSDRIYQLEIAAGEKTKATVGMNDFLGCEEGLYIGTPGILSRHEVLNQLSQLDIHIDLGYIYRQLAGISDNPGELESELPEFHRGRSEELGSKHAQSGKYAMSEAEALMKLGQTDIGIVAFPTHNAAGVQQKDVDLPNTDKDHMLVLEQSIENYIAPYMRHLVMAVAADYSKPAARPTPNPTP